MHRGGGTPDRADLLAGLRRLFAAFTLVTIGSLLLQLPTAEAPAWIETEDQAAVLREHGYAVGQGFLYARPMPAGSLQDLLGHASAVGLVR